MSLSSMSDFTFKHTDQTDKLYEVYSTTEMKTKLDSQAVTIRTFVNTLIGILNSITDGSSGADGISATAIPGLTGATVQALTESMKSIYDIHKAATTIDHPDSSITNAKMADNSVGTAELIDSNVTNIKMADSSIGTVELIDSSVTNAKMADSSVGTAELIDSSITNAKMADNSIGTAEIIDSSVTNAKMADNSVGTVEIIDSNVTNVKMADNSVGTAEIIDSSVTNAKMADSSVGTAEIINGNVTSGKLASGVAVSNIGYTPANKAGDTMVGQLIAQNNTSYTTAQARNITLSTSDASGGGNGDVWFKYTA